MRSVAVECHCQAKMPGAMLFKPIQSAGICDRVGANLECDIVAAKFTLVTNPRADPPNGGMKEEESLSDGLHDIPKEIGAAHMSELVSEDYLKFVGAERGESA